MPPVTVHSHTTAYTASRPELNFNTYAIRCVCCCQVFVHYVNCTFVADHSISILKKVFFQTFEFNSFIIAIKPNSYVSKVGLIFTPRKVNSGIAMCCSYPLAAFGKLLSMLLLMLVQSFKLIALSWVFAVGDELQHVLLSTSNRVLLCLVQFLAMRSQHHHDVFH